MKFINALLLISPLFAASVQTNWGSCRNGETRCSHTDPSVIRSCEGGEFAEYKCQGETSRCIVKGTAYFKFAQCV
jgi:hypothetical protein